MVNHVGPRLAMMTGGILCTGSLMISYWISSAVGYALTLGAMNGIGQCLIEQSHVIANAQYFDKKLSTANSIRVAGNPFGGFVYPLLFAFIFDHFGIPLTFLVLAAITANIFTCAMLLRPVDVHLKICAKDYVLKNTNSTGENTDRKKSEMFTDIIAQYPDINSKKSRTLNFSYLKVRVSEL